MVQTEEPAPWGHGQRVNGHTRGLLCCSKGENSSQAPLKAGVRPPAQDWEVIPAGKRDNPSRTVIVLLELCETFCEGP